MEVIKARSHEFTKSLRGPWRRIVLSIFQDYQKGILDVELPEGTILRFGEVDKKHTDTLYYARIKVLDENFFKRAVIAGDIGFGESYVAGEWETDSVTAVITFMIANLENNAAISGSKKKKFNINFLEVVNRLRHLLRKNGIGMAEKNIHEHYDLSNDFFKTFLDKSMTYSSAYFTSREKTLEEAQIEKYERLARALKIKKEDHVLEIGCGWGGFGRYLFKNYGCRVTGITISKQQFEYATKKCVEENIPSDKVTILYQDYRLLQGTFDKIASIEMLEAVGHEYLPVYFKKCHELLKQNGLLGLQVITSPDSRYQDFRRSVDWIQKHIFPGSLLPSIGEMTRVINKVSDMHLAHFEDFGTHYARTLREWRESFNKEREKVLNIGFDPIFIRKWNYYLSYCEAAFAMKNISVVQMVWTRPNNV
jgi:cyclopropane-fatty-acyl-phospholipid synthase